jgi:hypothetical protein
MAYLQQVAGIMSLKYLMELEYYMNVSWLVNDKVH